MVGSANEVRICVNDVKCKALLDTGSQVATVAEWFVKEHLQSAEVESLDSFLNVEDSSGNRLGYKGVVNCDISVSEITGGEGLVIPTPSLVVGDTRYNHSTPAIIGTNVLERCRDHGNCSDTFSQHWT